MRAIPLVAAAIVTLGLSQATAQPKMRDMDSALVTTTASYDDLNCAARYTLAAFVIHDLDANAATYYVQQASEAGKRYLALHPGESQQSYSSRVTAERADVAGKARDELHDTGIAGLGDQALRPGRNVAVGDLTAVLSRPDGPCLPGEPGDRTSLR